MYDRNILVEQTDPELFAAIQAENARQEHHIELIASENYASRPAPYRLSRPPMPPKPQATSSRCFKVFENGHPIE